MNPQQPTPPAETPRAEPEIIPPGVPSRSGRNFRPDRFAEPDARIHVTRVEIKKLGPVGTIVALLFAGGVALAGLALLLGFALVGIAAAGVIITGAILARILRTVLNR